MGYPGTHVQVHHNCPNITCIHGYLGIYTTTDQRYPWLSGFLVASFLSVTAALLALSSVASSVSEAFSAACRRPDPLCRGQRGWEVRRGQLQRGVNRVSRVGPCVVIQ